jgi:tRNA (guanine37-N1)-methyltransferase
MKFYSLLTLFPESIEPYLNSSILKRAQETLKMKGSKVGRKAVIQIKCIDPKKYAKDTRVDDKPYAGGPGMVLRAEPVLKAWDAAQKVFLKSYVKKSTKLSLALKNSGELSSPLSERQKQHVVKNKTVTIFLTPQGKQFDQDMAMELAHYEHVLFVCGRYEGVDARVREITNAREVSVGPFVLTGGELPAALMVDAIARHVPGVLGDFNSREDDRVASPDVYTRPETLMWNKKKYTVPPVLLSGDHKKIEVWRSEKRSEKMV